MNNSSPQPNKQNSEEIFTIRAATRADASAICALLKRAFVEFEPLYTPEAFAATAVPEAGMLARMEEGPVWVAEMQSVLIGTIAVLRMQDFIMMRGMAVAPSTRGLGVGKSLLCPIENFARMHGYRCLSLYTTAFLKQAIRLYEGVGFRFTGETFNPHGTELLRMVKVLDDPGIQQ